jgi:hypothetical protein
MRAFLNLRDSAQAEQMAHNILSTPIKIYSPEVTRIREFANNYLLNKNFRGNP